MPHPGAASDVGDYEGEHCQCRALLPRASALLSVGQVDAFPAVLCIPSLVFPDEKPGFGVMVSAVDRIAAQTMSACSENCDANILEEHLRQFVLALE